ncbi:hypothetical protein N7462_011182 [Penicillium macrosclerotiorum]|uniref:uncharacterized protein n=1 Tax=Penicillium macrosclerotiorum TaxID=303699 RepID=UPI002547E9F1|nr:uncharacterized protein N7462_011182 [Penicillium macrosclerotiorum]KAJ5666773.1 hypothetical protein N7462_011182 [Penicillium macrosclerotiorum]
MANIDNHGPTETDPIDYTSALYRDPLTEVQEPARSLLQDWSGIPAGKIAQHVNDLILERVKNGDQFLDLGCCFAQEVRLLVAAGAPPQNVFGADLAPDFINQGYELFLDKEKLHTRFITSDIFNSESPLAKEFTGRLNIIHASNFFHQWGWAQQIEAGKQVIKLLAGTSGSMIIGSQVGSKRAREIKFPALNISAFLHSMRTFKMLWEKVAQCIGIKLEFNASENRFLDHEKYGWSEEMESVRIIFTVRVI